MIKATIATECGAGQAVLLLSTSFYFILSDYHFPVQILQFTMKVSFSWSKLKKKNAMRQIIIRVFNKRMFLPMPVT